MVATQSFGIARRTLDVEDYIDIARRHAGWIAGPAFFGMVASIVVAFMLPNEYTSKATMQITPAQISENMLQSTINNTLNERIQTMETTIMSRAELSSIINDPKLQLYREEIKTTPIEDVIDNMKKDISIKIIALPEGLSRRGASAFDISFNYPDRYKAQATVAALMNKFDEVNQSTEKNQQDAVVGFFGDELNRAKTDLNTANEALTKFKEANAGKLPESTQLNLGREAMLTQKIQTDGESIFRDQTSITQLETRRQADKARLDIYDGAENDIDSGVLPGGPATRENQELAELNKSITSYNYLLEDLRKRYSELHPDVKEAESRLANLQKRHDQLMEEESKKLAAAAGSGQPVRRTTSIREQEVRQSITDDLNGIDAQEKAINSDADRLKKEQDAYKKDSDALGQMLKDSTGLEAPYEDLRRAQALAESNYQDQLRKQNVAQANSSLISRRAGENLEVLDVASLPVQPTKPNRYAIIGAGFALSLLLGLAVAGLQEARDTSLKNLKDVRAYTNLPVLCSIPLLENTMLVKRKRRLTYVFWAAAVLAGALAVTGSVIYYETFTSNTKS